MMKMLRRLQALIRPRRLEADLAEELEFHRAQSQAALERDGMSPADARAASRRRLGNATLAREDARAVWIAPWIDSVVQDLRIGARVMRRAPVSSAVAVLTIALGIGANIAVYSLVDATLFSPLPVPDPDRVVFFTEITSFGPSSRDFSMSVFERLRDGNHTLAGLAAYDGSRLSATIDGQPEMISGDFVSADYFPVMGVSAALGRTLAPSDDRPSSPRVVVISNGWWQRRFGGDPAVIGRPMLLGGLPFTIVGVMPPTYHGRRVSGASPDVTVPMAAHADLALRDHTTFALVGRLRPQVTIDMASSDLDGLYQRALADEPGPPVRDEARARLAAMSGLHGELGAVLGPNDTRQLLTVVVVVAVLLLITCVNVANLLVARTASRRKEIAVRASIGAGRGRLLRQFLTESLLLVVVASGISLLAARWAADVLSNVLPLPELTVHPAQRTGALLFTAALSAIAGLFLGLAPAVVALRVDIGAMLKTDDAGRIAGTGRHRTGKTLVVVQVALSLTLLVATGLLVRSLSGLYRVDPGVDTTRVLSAGIYPTLLRYDHPRELQLYRALLDTLERTPGVESASLTRYALGRSGINFIAPRLFTTLGVPIVRGRDLAAADVEAAGRVAVISESAARIFYADRDATGEQVPPRFARGLGALRIVGIVRDVHTSYRRTAAVPVVYVPYTLADPSELGQADVFVRARTDAASIAPALREAVHSVEPNLALLNVEPLSRDFDRSVGGHRALTTLLGTCGGLALALVAIGLYGTMSHAVARRTKELGIRISLGADRTHVLLMVLREAAAVVAIGFAIGIPLALVAARGVSTLLFGIGTADPPTLAAVLLLMFAVALLAGYVPARRAAGVDPIVALRAE